MADSTKLMCNVRAGFARTFHHWRLHSDIPLKQIAADLGVSLNTIYLWETGRRFPTGRNFEQLVNYTGLPPCRLFCIRSTERTTETCRLRQP